MDLNELIARLYRVRDGEHGAERGLDVEKLPGGRRRVIVRGQNADEFVWVEGVLESVEDANVYPDVVLVARVSPEQEAEVFTRVDEASEPVRDMHALRAVEPEYDDDFNSIPPGAVVSTCGGTGWPESSNPTPAQLASPEFEAVWQAIKRWDIGSPELCQGTHTGVMGNHVVQILKALAPVIADYISGVGGADAHDEAYDWNERWK